MFHFMVLFLLGIIAFSAYDIATGNKDGWK